MRDTVHRDRSVRSLPYQIEASQALAAYLADSLGLRRSEIRILSGETGRRKMVLLSGDGAAIADRLATWIGDAPIRR